MLKINEELKKYNLKPTKYTNYKNVVIVDTDNGSYVFKKNTNSNIFEYLKTKNFTYFPTIYSDLEDEYLITKYINSIDITDAQKATDIIDLVSLLHNKTTHYKNVSIDEYKKIYEDISNNIEYLYNYYNDLMTIIESKVYMSPPEYLLAINISKIYGALNYCKKTLDDWYDKIKDKKNKRLVVIHNNLKLEHFINSNEPYLISWDKAKIDMPIFDIYKLFKYNDNFDYSGCLKRYENKYPLKEDERLLLFVLLALPDEIKFNESNLNMCIKITEQLNLLDSVSNLVSPYYLKNTEKDKKPEYKY